MNRIEDELARSLRELREPVDEEAIFRRLVSRRRRRIRGQRLQRATLAAVVVVGSVVGVYGLWRAFELGPRTERGVSPDPFSNLEQLMYWTRGEGGWALVRAGDGTTVTSRQNVPVSSAISPDGAWVAIAEGAGEGKGSVRLVNVDTGAVETVGPLPPVTSIAWADPTEVWLCDGEGSIRSVLVPDGEVRLIAEAVRCVDLALSPDGGRVAFSTSNGDVVIASRSDASSSEVVVRGVNLGAPSWSPDGARLAFHRFHGSEASIDMLDVQSGEVSTAVEGAESLNLRPAWSPDGATIAFVHIAEDAPPEVRVLDLASSTVRAVGPSDGDQDLPLWDPTAGSGASPDDGIFFPTWQSGSALPQALLTGATLVRHDACLFARGSSGEEELLVWPPGFRFEETAGGRVVDGAGQVVATVGGPLPRMGGGNYTATFAEESLIGGPIPEPCRGPGESIWLVGEIEGHPPVDTEQGGLEVGVAYPIALYTHCGIDFWTRFDGSYWDAVGYDNSSGNPPPGLGNPRDFGTMTLVSEDVAEYRSDGGMVIRFVRAAERPEGMACF